MRTGLGGEDGHEMKIDPTLNHTSLRTLPAGFFCFVFGIWIH